MAPGGRAALARGCTCSVLANAAFRVGVSYESLDIDPDCPIHATRPDPSGQESEPDSDRSRAT